MSKKLDKTITNSPGIYCIENIINNKKYIGKSTQIRKRILVHISKLRDNKSQCIYLQNAWNKYKENNFNFYVLEYCDKTELNNKEEYWIKKLETFYSKSNGYNLTKGGEGIPGYIHTSETKNKISKSKTNPSSITRVRNSDAARGIKRKTKSTSCYVGVSFDSRTGKWKSQYEYMQNRYWLGRFDTETDAAIAYNLKAIEICGNDARINKIGEN